MRHNMFDSALSMKSKAEPILILSPTTVFTEYHVAYPVLTAVILHIIL